MKAAKFEYKKPRTIAEACASLREDNALALAGGQSLVPMLISVWRCRTWWWISETSKN